MKTGVATAAAALLVPVVAVSPAGAAPDTVPHFTGAAAGSTITALGGAVTSGPTAPSAVDSMSVDAADTNAVAAVPLAPVATAGAVTTSVAAAPVTAGSSVTATARTAGVSLLNGLIKVDAVKTVATATVAAGKSTSTIGTTLVGVKVGALKIPVSVPKNFTISVPGVAKIVFNYQAATSGAGAMSVKAAGVVVTLLKGVANNKAGSVVTINPVTAAIDQAGAGFRVLDGFGFATDLRGGIGGQPNIYLPTSGYTRMPGKGTASKDLTNNTAAVNLPPVATVQAVGSTANGIAADAGSRATETARVAGLNLLGGLIKADAVTASTTISVAGSAAAESTRTSTLAKLVIGGKPISVDAAPNSTIDIANVATVMINAQKATATSSSVAALVVTLTTAAYGLPVGAVITVAAASVSFV